MALYVRGIKSKLGNLVLTVNDTALLKIEFCACEQHDEHPLLDLVEKQLMQYFSGERKQFSVPIEIDGSEFQKKCWMELQKILYATTISYKEQALRVASIKHTRAVANANNKNPIPIIIPCHRVIGSNGSLVGFAAGVDIKQKLLEIESKYS